MPAGWGRLRAAILNRDQHRCADCGRPATEVDHVVARALGGSDHPANLQAVCHRCHAHRTATTVARMRRP